MSAADAPATPGERGAREDVCEPDVPERRTCEDCEEREATECYENGVEVCGVCNVRRELNQMSAMGRSVYLESLRAASSQGREREVVEGTHNYTRDRETLEACVREAAENVRGGRDPHIWLPTLLAHAITFLEDAADMHAALTASAPPAQPSEVRYVAQRESWDCGVAAIAMVAGIDYDEALASIPDSVVSRAKAEGGLLSIQMPQLLGGLGVSLRHAFHSPHVNPWWDADGFKGIRLYVSAGHFIVVRPDGRVNDPARGEGLPIENYGIPFDGWEVHRVPDFSAPPVDEWLRALAAAPRRES